MLNQDQDANNNVPLRDELVKTAVKFLQNPKVLQSPLKQKKTFLQRKGLTEEEVERACEIAGANTIESEAPAIPRHNEFTAIPMPGLSNYPYYPRQLGPPSLFTRVKEVLNNVAIIGATVYCIYWFYQKFIQPFLFGRKKKKTVEETVTELDQTVNKTLKEMKDTISNVESDVHKLTQHQLLDPSVPQLVHDLKQDLASLKGLLLSRKQFPSVPVSIPSWQLATNTNQEKTSEREDLDDAGSGSSTNNSDSSLEMIKEDLPKN